MKRFFLVLLASISLLHAQEASPTPAPSTTPVTDTAAEASARSAALELAGAFSNDGYKIRDGYYFGALEPGKSTLIEVNLFAGNEYWFCAAGNAPVVSSTWSSTVKMARPWSSRATWMGRRRRRESLPTRAESIS